jgi:hypothetical protein
MKRAELFIAPYLRSYLDVADTLPIALDNTPPEMVERLQERLRQLVGLVANRDAQIVQLEARLEKANAR